MQMAPPAFVFVFFVQSNSGNSYCLGDCARDHTDCRHVDDYVVTRFCPELRRRTTIEHKALVSGIIRTAPIRDIKVVAKSISELRKTGI